LHVVLAAVAIAIFITLVEVNALEYVWEEMGVSHRWFGTLLLAAVIGSTLNLPVGHTAPAADGGRTAIAVNVGGALIPVGLAAWALTATQSWGAGLLATAVVAAVTHQLARLVPGVGVALSPFVPGPVAALAAMLLAPGAAPAVAWSAGALGTLLGADVLNLRRIGAMGAPVASIGGAGTFDGIFVTGLLAALLA
jgi:uncharacterized membrane protein